MPNYCSPSKISHKSINTCYDSDDITAIATAFNKYIKTSTICKDDICISSQPIDLNIGDEQLYKELSDILGMYSYVKSKTKIEPYIIINK